MRNLIRAASTVLALCLANAALAQTFTTRPFLSVQGHAEVKVKPDLFPVTVTVRETGMNAAKIQETVEALASQVVAAAKFRSVVDDDMEVGNLSVSPESKWNDEKETETVLGNTYERVIKVRFRNLEMLKQFIADIPDQRTVRIETEDFQYSGKRELQRKLRRDAIRDAKAVAEDMAGAVDKKLVELFNVSDRAQSTIYSSLGYSSFGGDPMARSIGTVTVTAARRTSDIVLREGELTISADAFLVYIIGD